MDEAGGSAGLRPPDRPAFSWDWTWTSWNWAQTLKTPQDAPSTPPRLPKTPTMAFCTTMYYSVL